MDEALFVQLSAYADGELNAVERLAVEQQLAQRSELVSELKLYKRLDEVAIDISKSQADLTDNRLSVDTKDAVELNHLKIVAALTAPVVSSEKFDRVWQKIAQRITVEAPLVSAERWQSVWRDIQHRIEKPKTAIISDQAKSRPIVAVNFQRARRHAWRWLIAAGAAAIIALAVIFPRSTLTTDELVALEIPDDPNDNSYQARVKFIEGQSEPLVTFYRPTDSPSLEITPDNWRWLPN